MDSAAKPKQPHVVCIAYPAQSHVKAVLKLAKLLHSRGIFITFVNTEYNHKRFLKSGGPNCLDGVPGFRFETIPDGLPPTDVDVTQDTAALCRAIQNNFLAPFQRLMEKLNENDGKVGVPPITSILSDGFMTCTIDAAKVLGIPIVLFWTIAACSFMGFYQYHVLLEKGLTPLKDESFLTNGYLDTVVDWIPGMKGIRLKDLPSFIRTTDKNELVFNHIMVAAQRAALGTAHVLLTFDALEQELVNALVTMFPNFYTIGPQQILLDKISIQEEYLGGVRYSLWEEESDCLQWLESKEPNSVVYVNFGSITVMTSEQLVEFGWGLANSNHYFLWVIRPDLIVGGSGHFEREFLEVTREKGFIASWCPQEKVLNHVAVGGFLTHGGWNSTIESISSGVPMLCWPFFGDQITNCKYMCDEWKCGMEIGNDVRRQEVEKLVKELMDGVEGKRMKKAAMEWKVLAEDACSPGGSSFLNLDKLVAFFEN